MGEYVKNINEYIQRTSYLRDQTYGSYSFSNNARMKYKNMQVTMQYCIWLYNTPHPHPHPDTHIHNTSVAKTLVFVNVARLNQCALHMMLPLLQWVASGVYSTICFLSTVSLNASHVWNHNELLGNFDWWGSVRNHFPARTILNSTGCCKLPW